MKSEEKIFVCKLQLTTLKAQLYDALPVTKITDSRYPLQFCLYVGEWIYVNQQISENNTFAVIY